MSATKKLGKILSVELGFGGYDNAIFGVSFTLGNDEWTVQDFMVVETGSSKAVNESINTMIALRELCKDAKVNNINNLVNVPVEVEFDNRAFKSFRILTEVL